jgi:hypothetical protein
MEPYDKEFWKKKLKNSEKIEKKAVRNRQTLKSSI